MNLNFPSNLFYLKENFTDTTAESDGLVDEYVQIKFNYNTFKFYLDIIFNVYS